MPRDFHSLNTLRGGKQLVLVVAVLIYGIQVETSLIIQSSDAEALY
jgi:hypothetical protein